MTEARRYHGEEVKYIAKKVADTALRGVAVVSLAVTLRGGDGRSTTSTNDSDLYQRNPQVLAAETEDTPPKLDMLQFFLPDKEKIGLTGSHRLSHITDYGNRKTYDVKFGDQRSFELHTWDEEGNIYLVNDNSDPDNPYNFTNGLWMKRFMAVGESFHVSPDDNQIERFKKECKPDSKKGFGYTMRLANYYEQYDTEGDLGVLDNVIELTYQPDGGKLETFRYNPQIGWFYWQSDDFNGVMEASAHFNAFDKRKPTLPKEGTICVWPEPDTINSYGQAEIIK